MGGSEPPAPAVQPRYSTRVFPPYRFIPGVTPHPRRHPEGHSFGLTETPPRIFRHGEWAGSEDYLFAIDLYNFAYWWEAHEILEGLWHACGRATQEGNFFQALIQLAAANLKQAMGCQDAAEKLVQRGLARLQTVPPPLHGSRHPRLGRPVQAVAGGPARFACVDNT